MGKRKSSRKPMVKIKPKLSTTFDCPLCHSTASILIRLNKVDKMGMLRCNVCRESWMGRVNGLSEAVDVYHEWIDSMEALEKKRRVEEVVEEDGFDMRRVRQRVEENHNNEEDEEEEEERAYQELMQRGKVLLEDQGEDEETSPKEDEARRRSATPTDDEG